MILRLVHPGGRPSGPLEAVAQEYLTRLQRYVRTDERFVKPSGAAETARALADEAERIVQVVGPRDRLVILDREARPWSSEALAERLAAWQGMGLAALCVVLGSASGLDPSLRARANERWSLGPLTLPHDLARVVMWEQIYRGFKILRGEPYHK